MGDDAADELRAGRRHIVIAHGNSQGTVKWFKSSRGTADPWLWVNMPRPPRDALVYLYSCKAGKKLPRFLKHCQVFGHVDVVPMPTDTAADTVLGYLCEVEKLMAGGAFDSETWRRELGAYVNRELVREVERRTGILNGALLLMLRRSLGYADE